VTCDLSPGRREGYDRRADPNSLAGATTKRSTRSSDFAETHEKDKKLIRALRHRRGGATIRLTLGERQHRNSPVGPALREDRAESIPETIQEAVLGGAASFIELERDRFAGVPRGLGSCGRVLTRRARGMTRDGGGRTRPRSKQPRARLRWSRCARSPWGWWMRARAERTNCAGPATRCRSSRTPYCDSVESPSSSGPTSVPGFTLRRGVFRSRQDLPNVSIAEYGETGGLLSHLCDHRKRMRSAPEPEERSAARRPGKLSGDGEAKKIIADTPAVAARLFDTR
jgi:hypothetical protein